MALLFIQLTDLRGHPVAIRLDDVDRVNHPVPHEYPGSPGAVIRFKNGTAQAVMEDVMSVMHSLNSAHIDTTTTWGPLTKTGGNHGGPRNVWQGDVTHGGQPSEPTK